MLILVYTKSETGELGLSAGSGKLVFKSLNLFLVNFSFFYSGFNCWFYLIFEGFFIIDERSMLKVKY